MNRTELIETLKALAAAADDERDYREKCGFIGYNGHEWSTWSLSNVATEGQSNYETSPTEQVMVYGKMQEAGYQLWGVYHTHRLTANPSNADRLWAYPPELKQVIATPKEVKVYVSLGGNLDLTEVSIP